MPELGSVPPLSRVGEIFRFSDLRFFLGGGRRAPPRVYAGGISVAHPPPHSSAPRDEIHPSLLSPDDGFPELRPLRRAAASLLVPATLSHPVSIAPRAQASGVAGGRADRTEGIEDRSEGVGIGVKGQGSFFLGVVDPAWLTPNPPTHLDLFVQGLNDFCFYGRF